jgi:hypothetical protein
MPSMRSTVPFWRATAAIALILVLAACSAATPTTPASTATTAPVASDSATEAPVASDSATEVPVAVAPSGAAPTVDPSAATGTEVAASLPDSPSGALVPQSGGCSSLGTRYGTGDMSIWFYATSGWRLMHFYGGATVYVDNCGNWTESHSGTASGWLSGSNEWMYVYAYYKGSNGSYHRSPYRCTANANYGCRTALVAIDVLAGRYPVKVKWIFGYNRNDGADNMSLGNAYIVCTLHTSGGTSSCVGGGGAGPTNF